MDARARALAWIDVLPRQKPKVLPTRRRIRHAEAMLSFTLSFCDMSSAVVTGAPPSAT